LALASNGGTASASSTLDDGRLPIAAINGDRKGIHWGSDPSAGSGWHDANTVYPDWLQVDFNGSKMIDEIDVFSLQDDVSNPSEPTETMTFSQYGITDFDLQYWNGIAWVTVPGASVTGNNKVWCKLTFAAITTSKIRVLVSNSLNSYSRIVELEAWGVAAPPPPTNVALAATGAIATASSTLDSGRLPIAANNGDRQGIHWGSDPATGSGWHDANSVYPDWLQIDFNGNKTIDEIDVFSVQDNVMNPSEPTETMTFSQYGITDFDLQYWNGTAWVTLPGGSVVGNNKVWRKFTFAAITTSKIRVLVNNSLDSYSRIAEVEAWGTDSNVFEDGMINTETSAAGTAENVRLFNRVYSTDFAVFGMGGLRDVGYGSLLVSNVVGTVRQANLYWHGPTSTNSFYLGSSVLVNGIRVYGTPIGTSDDNNWCCGYVNSQAYRADITSLVGSSPNKYYTLSGFAEYAPAYVRGGFNPNGASLVVFYDDGNASNNRDVSLYDGNDSNELNFYDADGWNAFLPGIEYASGQAILQLHVSDGQSYVDPSVALNSAPFLSGYSFQGFTVPSGNGSFFFDNLWDIRSFDVTSYLHSGTNALSITSPRPFGTDALSIILALVSVPAVPPAVRITNARVTGNLSGTTQNALIGANVNLVAMASPPGIGSGNYSWVLQGQAGSDYDVVSGGTNSSTLNIRWRKPGSYLATVNYVGTGVNLSSNITVNSVLPSLSNFSGSIAANMINVGSHCSGIPDEVTYTLGCYQPNGPLTGMVFSATAQIPANVVYLTDNSLSGVKFKQGTTVYAKELIEGRLQCTTSRTDPNVYATGWGLDTVDPLVTGYQYTKGPQYFSNVTSVSMTQFDPPGAALQTGYLVPHKMDALVEDNWFEDYVFYFVGSNPGTPTFEYPQPLRFTNSPNPIDRLAWRWGGYVVWDPYQSTSYRQIYSTSTSPGPITATGASGAVPLSRVINSDNPLTVLCPGAPDTYNPIDDNQFFVYSLYEDLFLRQPDPNGELFWTAQITSVCGLDTLCIYGNRSGPYGQRLAVAKANFYSDEFKVKYPYAADLANPPGSPNFNASTYNPAYIRALYIGFLKRDPLTPPADPGYQWWLNNLNTFGNYDGIMDAFITGPEYRRRFGDVDPHW
jgi:hypothetical protein